ncbi:suppressor of cytokine signaling 3 [Oryzias latipes]|uniref:Suppressor of cytokine signaling 3a n=2 Tax=Oryzias latipes TaxID=8090 RepID=B1NJG2_ORYLA|nr:suppressor of cytokine signaling 3 [Oryzias latipes]ABQ53610.1 suppressor of cytokine signaling 3a [Oryzias latipes]
MVTQSKCNSTMSNKFLDTKSRVYHFKTFSSRAQYQMVIATYKKLLDCGFYWSTISGKEANALLEKERTGTFLIRDSSDNRHLFTLSVKTVVGPKSVRIKCDSNAFYLQSDTNNTLAVPRFDCILKLIEFYMPRVSGGCVIYYIHNAGEKIPLDLRRPYSCNLSTLQHLCRRTVNSHSDISSKKDELPQTIRDFLQEYDASI